MLTIDENNIGHDYGYFMSPDTDSFYNVKLTKYFGLNQEAAAIHASLRGVGIKELQETKSKTWMILRTRMRINKMASFLDEYRIDTWCQKKYKLYNPRAVCAYTKNTNELLFSAENLWIIMDTIKMRPERPDSIIEALGDVKKENLIFDPVFPAFPEKEEYKGKSTEKIKAHVNYFDYDCNRHVNNISYVSWTLDSFSPSFLDCYRPSFFDTVWKKQCHFEDNIKIQTIQKDESSLSFYTSITKETDNGEEEVFGCISSWKEK